MKLRTLIPIAAVFICIIVFCVWIAFPPESGIEWHKRAWFTAVNEMVRQRAGGRVGLSDELKRILGRYRDPYQQMRDHEHALLQLGYLTNIELRLTNQTVTTEFYSNFFVRIRTELGTNEDQVWIGTPLSNKAGFRPLLPAKDVAAWERIFRDCYAANVPSVISTNGP